MQYIVPLSTVPFPLLIFAIFSQEQHLVAICMFNRLSDFSFFNKVLFFKYLDAALKQMWAGGNLFKHKSCH